VTRNERNTAIIAKAKAGATQRELAAEYGLSKRMIGHVCNTGGYRVPLAEAGRRGKGITGRPRICTDDPKHYAKLRSIFGAAQAKAMLGIAP
jgi:hypothetical protein